MPVWFNGDFSCHAQKICNSCAAIVLKNNLFEPDSFSGEVTYAITDLSPNIFVITRRTPI